MPRSVVTGRDEAIGDEGLDDLAVGDAGSPLAHGHEAVDEGGDAHGGEEGAQKREAADDVGEARHDLHERRGDVFRAGPPLCHGDDMRRHPASSWLM